MNGCSTYENLRNNIPLGGPSTPLNTTNGNKPDQKMDISQLLIWFEQSCGSTQAYYNPNSKEFLNYKNYQAFKESFRGKRYLKNGNYVSFVRPDYRSRLPPEYRNIVKKITGEDNSDRFKVYFNNATYRGYDLSYLEIYSEQESDYLYDTLHFKNDDFINLKSVFKSSLDDMGEMSGGEFDTSNRSIMCYLGL